MRAGKACACVQHVGLSCAWTTAALTCRRQHQGGAGCTAAADVAAAAAGGRAPARVQQGGIAAPVAARLTGGVQRLHGVALPPAAAHTGTGPCQALRTAEEELSRHPSSARWPRCAAAAVIDVRAVGQRGCLPATHNVLAASNAERGVPDGSHARAQSFHPDSSQAFYRAVLRGGGGGFLVGCGLRFVGEVLFFVLNC